MPNRFLMAGMIFCLGCGSSRVDINSWKIPGQAIVTCCNCGKTGEMQGFTIGRCFSVDQKAVREAYEDRALPRRGTA